MPRRGMRDACKYRTAYRQPIRRGMSRFPRFDVRVSSEASALRNEGGPAMPMPAHSWDGTVAEIANFPSTGRARSHSSSSPSDGPVLTMISCARRRAA